jgi:hypothetical protein
MIDHWVIARPMLSVNAYALRRFPTTHVEPGKINSTLFRGTISVIMLYLRKLKISLLLNRIFTQNPIIKCCSQSPVIYNILICFIS